MSALCLESCSDVSVSDLTVAWEGSNNQFVQGTVLAHRVAPSPPGAASTTPVAHQVDVRFAAGFVNPTSASFGSERLAVQLWHPKAAAGVRIPWTGAQSWFRLGAVAARDPLANTAVWQFQAPASFAFPAGTRVSAWLGPAPKPKAKGPRAATFKVFACSGSIALANLTAYGGPSIQIAYNRGPVTFDRVRNLEYPGGLQAGGPYMIVNNRGPVSILGCECGASSDDTFGVKNGAGAVLAPSADAQALKLKLHTDLAANRLVLRVDAMDSVLVGDELALWVPVKGGPVESRRKFLGTPRVASVRSVRPGIYAATFSNVPVKPADLAAGVNFFNLNTANAPLTVSGCTLRSGRAALFNLQDATDVTIADNTIVSLGAHGIVSAASSDYLMSGLGPASVRVTNNVFDFRNGSDVMTMPALANLSRPMRSFDRSKIVFDANTVVLAPDVATTPLAMTARSVQFTNNKVQGGGVLKGPVAKIAAQDYAIQGTVVTATADSGPDIVTTRLAK